MTAFTLLKRRRTYQFSSKAKVGHYRDRLGKDVGRLSDGSDGFWPDVLGEVVTRNCRRTSTSFAGGSTTRRLRPSEGGIDLSGGVVESLQVVNVSHESDQLYFRSERRKTL